MRCNDDWYSLIVYTEEGLQLAIGEYCAADGSGKCYRAYANGRFDGRVFSDLHDASEYIEAAAELWHTEIIWRGRAKDVPYTGEKWRPKKILQALTGGPLPGFKVNNKRR